MVDAYDHGVVCPEDRERAMRCKALDELEEFALLMRHYCLLMGFATSLSRGRCTSGRRRATKTADPTSAYGCVPWDCLPRWDSEKDDARR
jgi:hypothetical protein